MSTWYHAPSFTFVWVAFTFIVPEPISNSRYKLPSRSSTAKKSTCAGKPEHTNKEKQHVFWSYNILHLQRWWEEHCSNGSKNLKKYIFQGSQTNLGVFLAASSIFAFLTLSVSEEDESIGLSRAEVKRDWSHPLGIPLGEANVRFWSLKGDWVQCGHILTLVGHLTLDFHL